MAEKKPPNKGAAKAAPKNKQRVTLVTRRERAAHDSMSGWKDERIPESAAMLMAGLSEVTLERVARALGDYRFSTNYVDNSLTDSERRAQAKSISATLDAAIERMRKMDPNVSAYVETVWARAPWNNPPQSLTALWNEQVAPLLYRVVAVVNEAAKMIPPSKKGRKTSWARDQLLKGVMGAVAADESSPSLEDSRQLAAAVLRECGIGAPSDERNLRRRAGGRKKNAKSVNSGPSQL